MLPNIDSLALFVRAAELRSLTKAADASYMGLAAASRRIALLEHRFKTTLFDRSPRGVDLTPAGETLLMHAKALLIQTNQMQAEMSDHAAGRRGVLRLMANTSAITDYLPNDLAEFSRARPEIQLIIEERWSSEIVQAVLSAETDVGIIVEGPLAEGVAFFPYRHDRLAVVMPTGHRLSTLGELRFNDVLDHDIVALEKGASMMRLLTEQAVMAEKTLQLRIQVRSFEAVCRMVQSGAGIGLLPFQAASAIGSGLGLTVRPLTEPWAARNMMICVRKDRLAHSSISRLLKHLSTATQVQ
jgi:DNA-binding transcriptional LysR family regulator